MQPVRFAANSMAYWHRPGRIINDATNGAVTYSTSEARGGVTRHSAWRVAWQSFRSRLLASTRRTDDSATVRGDGLRTELVIKVGARPQPIPFHSNVQRGPDWSRAQQSAPITHRGNSERSTSFLNLLAAKTCPMHLLHV